MPISQYILDAREQTRLEVRQRNTWLIILRWYYLLVLGGVATVTSLLAQDDATRNRQIALTAAGIGIAINLILWALTRPKNKTVAYYQVIAVSQQLLDVLLASSVIYARGGLASRATILFAVPLVSAGLLFTRRFAYVTALMCSVGYTLAMVLYRHNNPGSYELHEITLPAVFYGVSFFIIATIASAYRNRTASNEREKSYAELMSLLRHQLYQPTSVISAIVDTLEGGEHYSSWPEKDKAYLQQLKHENKRQHTMIENLLESITDKGPELKEIKPVDIVKLLQEEATSSSIGAKRTEDLEKHIPRKGVLIDGDANQLSIALTNILSNAFRYTDRGTPVIVSLVEESDQVTISIHDKGKGISEADQKALFKLFAKMESRVSDDPEKLYDTGLGLYVSKLIVERHKGTLELASSAQYGTNIIITLHKRHA